MSVAPESTVIAEVSKDNFALPFLSATKDGKSPA